MTAVQIKPFTFPRGGGSSMAKSSKPKDFIYRFREAGPEEAVSNALINLRVDKCHPTSGEVLNTYHLWGDDADSLLCDCPGAMYHADKSMHKHSVWAAEWLELTTIGGWSKASYYDTIQERFIDQPEPSKRGI